MSVRFGSVYHRIFVGNTAAARDAGLLNDNNITAIINLSGESNPPVEGVFEQEYLLPSQELMHTEFPKTLAKLKTIAREISELRNDILGPNECILIHCADGRNKCILAASYYLITVQNESYNGLIDRVIELYFTQDQKNDEKSYSSTEYDCQEATAEQQLIANEHKAAAEMKRDERQSLKCLSMATFRQILRDASVGR